MKSLDPLTYLVFIIQVKNNMEDSWVDADVWRMELYLSVGIMALGLLSLLAVASLPSVANTVNWREFTFIQVHTVTHTHFMCASYAAGLKQSDEQRPADVTVDTYTYGQTGVRLMST